MQAKIYQRNRKYYENRIKQIVKYFPINNTNVLDLGCGECLLFKHFSNSLNSYIGIDIEPYLTEQYFIHGDILDQSLWPKTNIDLVFCLGVLDHLSIEEVNNLTNTLASKRFPSIVISKANTHSFLNKLMNLIGRKKGNTVQINFEGYVEKFIYLLKLPGFQFVLPINNSSIFKNILATEIIYIMTLDKR